MRDILDYSPEKKKRWFRPEFASIWVFIWIVGLLFKVQHWPLATLLLIIGSAGGMAYAIRGMLVNKSMRVGPWFLFGLNGFYLLVAFSSLLPNPHYLFSLNLRALLIYLFVFLLMSLIYWGKYFAYRRKQAH